MQSTLFAFETDAPPAIVFWENVPGVLSTKDNAFGCFLAGLAGEDEPLRAPGGKWANAGAVYGPARAVAWRTLDAQYLGLAQRRRRVFVVASARDGLDPATILFEWDGVRRDSAPRREARKVAPTNPSRSLGGGGLGTDFDLDGGLIARAVSLRGREGGATAELGDDIQNCLRASGGGGDKPHVLLHADPIAFGGNNTAGPIDVATARNACASASGRIDFESETFLVQPVAFNARQDPDHWHDRTGPLDTDGSTQAVAFAQNSRDEVRLEGGDGQRCGALSTGGGKPGQGVPMVATAQVVGTMSAAGATERKHGFGWGQQDWENGYCQPTLTMQVRRLTPTECERLQGFPDDYLDIPYRGKPAADGPKYKALGNSWAVPVVRWIGERIQAAA